MGVGLGNWRAMKKSNSMNRLGRGAYFVINLALIGFMVLLFGGLGAKELPAGVLLIIGVIQLPLLAMRLIDAGRSGWWALLSFIPLVNLVVGLLALALPSAED